MLAFHFSMERRCPVCNSGYVHRSMRRGFAESWILPLLLTRPFRCEECDARYFGPVFAARVSEKSSGDKLHNNHAKP